MSIKDTIEYACFCTMICNGTSGVAQMKNKLMSSPKSRIDTRAYFFTKMDEQGETFYDVLIHLWRKHKINPKSNHPGACTDPRFQTTACTTNWGEKSKLIFRKCKELFQSDDISTNQSMMKARVKALTDYLGRQKDANKRTMFSGAGPFTTGCFIQVLSLLGVIPLYCFTYAEVIGPKQGSAKFIKLGLKEPCLSPKKCNEHLLKIHEDFCGVWGPLITIALLENMFCELFRSYEATVKYIKQNKIDVDFKHPFDIMLSEHVQPSPKKDIYFEDNARKCVENSYLLRMSGARCDHLRPILCMRHSSLLSNRNIKSEMKLTNWLQNDNDPQLLSWSKKNLQITLNSTLNVHKDLKTIMALH